MTKPTESNLAIYKGATFEHRFAFVDENDEPVNVTGYTARMMIREEWDSPDPPLISLTESSGIAISGSLGVFDVTISAIDTAALTVDKAVYDLEAVQGPKVIKLARGKIKVYPEVTR